MEKTIEGISPRREKAHAIYVWAEGAVKIILAAGTAAGWGIGAVFSITAR